jgi:hypothetical protein
MRVNPNTSIDAARRLAKLTHQRIQSRTERIEQAYRHQREQRDKPQLDRDEQDGKP